MKEQARLREEMNYQYRLGNFQVGSLFLNFASFGIRSWWFNTHFSDSNQTFPDIRLQLQSRKDWILMLPCSSRFVDSPIPCSYSLAFLDTVGRRAYLSILNGCQLLRCFLYSVPDATFVLYRQNFEFQLFRLSCLFPMFELPSSFITCLVLFCCIIFRPALPVVPSLAAETMLDHLQ